jgi:uncharacterized protein YecT (DUF1311 family)
MLSLFLASLTLGAQMPEFAPPRPAVECAEHLTDWRARRGCLVGLLERAEDELAAAVDAAREEASGSDLDSGGLFHAEAALDAAQAAWTAYRDAECERRGALMFISAESREEIGLDCRISLTRARATELREM